MNFGDIGRGIEAGARATWGFAKQIPGKAVEFGKDAGDWIGRRWENLTQGVETAGKDLYNNHLKDAGETAGNILKVVVDEGRNNFTDEGLAKLVPAAQVLSRVARGALGVRDNGIVDRGVGALETGLAVAANWREHKVIALATLTAAFIPRMFRLGMRAGDIAAALRAVSDVNGFVKGVFARKDEFRPQQIQQQQAQLLTP